MVEMLDGMPAGTTGFRVTGRVTAADYRETIEPALRTAVEGGDVRIVCAIGPEYEGLDLGGLVEDLKTGVTFLARHHGALRREAIVTDIDWIAYVVRLFKAVMPGEVEVFAPDRLDEAKRWVVG
jgi:hypothetical protein